MLCVFLFPEEFLEYHPFAKAVQPFFGNTCSLQQVDGKKKKREASKREDFLMNNPPELGSQWTTSALLQLSCSWDISVQKKKILHNPIGC